MFNLIDRIKFNWLRSRHYQKNLKSANPGTDESSSIDNCELQPIRQSSRACVIKHRNRGWISHLNPLHFEKRSCAHIRDVYKEEDHHDRQQAVRSKANAKDQRLQSLGSSTSSSEHKPDHQKAKSDQINHGEVTILVSHKQQGSGAAMSMGSQLKNRVLPLIEESVERSVQENTSSSDQPSNTLLQLKDILIRPTTTLTLGAPVHSVKHIRLPKSPESPRSARELKWWKLLSHSGSGSPKSSSCNELEWNIQQVDRATINHTLQKGSMSTMGSPWNSGAAPGDLISHRCSSNDNSRRSSFKINHKQGHWITTDSEYVVLEL